MYGPNLLPGVGGFFGGKFDVYVCASCGHTAFFVRDKHLKEFGSSNKKFKKVTEQ